MTFGTVAILGPGLIGGSLALALAERSAASELRIYARKDATFPVIREKLPQAKLTTDVVEAVRGADVVVLCVPIETMGALVKQFADVLKPTTLVTDVGSVKECVENEIAPLLAGKALWIGSHPMAGSERAGFSVARPDLFVGAKVILTPSKTILDEAFKRAESFWQKVGGSTLQTTPFRHDQIVAFISHLPHVAASALVNAMEDDFFRAAGSGFRDTTRIASGSADLWTGILSENREKVGEAIDKLIQELEAVKKSLKENDKEHLHSFLAHAHDQRSKHIKS